MGLIPVLLSSHAGSFMEKNKIAYRTFSESGKAHF
jgi:hypothetical protein